MPALRASIPVTLSLLLGGCALATDEPPAPRPRPALPVPTPVDTAALPRAAYDAAADGFVVHEWGTLTSVRGSDGSLLPGLHHEEEDLPPFVADRLTQAQADPSVVLDPTRQKMETPVTYFYAPGPRRVTARVSFPQGLLTQWYPFVRTMTPSVFTIAGQLVDRYTQAPQLIPAACQSAFHQPLRGGQLDWGEIEIQGPAESAPLPAATSETTWGFARKTAANPLRVRGAAGDQYEKFLFYRGLGDFDLPLRVSFDGARAVLRNGDVEAPLRGLVLMVVTADGAGFTPLSDLTPGGSLTADLPVAALPHDKFVATLKTWLAARLIDDGLYGDEAIAMVDTWERAYFLTPGVRLLYLLPRVQTDRLLPLRVDPAPDAVARTMVIRTEILTPAYEQVLAGWVTQLGGSETEREGARGRFLALGRFAEPLLTRAMALVADGAARAAATSLLVEVQARRRWAPTAAE